MPNDPQADETLRDGSRIVVRPMQRTDIELERHFIEALSPEARRFRFLGSMNTPSDALLHQLTDIDEQRDAALIALSGEGQQLRQVGAARFSAAADGRAEVAVSVSDDWRQKGLASLLMHRLIGIARHRGIKTLYSMDSAENAAMRRLADYLGFERGVDPQDATQVIYTLQLNALASQ
ncbi:MAG: GNAT family N-acetyltransferase [Steroidobacteraceae bacterium]